MLYNIIQHNANFLSLNIPQSKALDAFCGTGIVGLELISLGFQSCTFIDKKFSLIKGIYKDAQHLGLNPDQYRTINQSLPHKIEGVFDFVFMDPPYENSNVAIEQIIIMLKNKNIAHNGWIVVESLSNFNPKWPNGLEVALEKKINTDHKFTFLQFNQAQ